MKAITKNKAEYIVAEPYLCLCALLEYIGRLFTDKSISQLEIANKIGLCVPPSYSGKVNNVLKSSNPAQWGIVVDDNGLNPFFRQNGLNLSEEYVSINSFLDEYELLCFVESQIDKDCKILLWVSYGKLNNKPLSVEFGHVVMLENVNKNVLTVYDPGPFEAGLKKYDISILFSAIKYKYSGISLIKREDNG